MSNIRNMLCCKIKHSWVKLICKTNMEVVKFSHIWNVSSKINTSLHHISSPEYGYFKALPVKKISMCSLVRSSSVQNNSRRNLDTRYQKSRSARTSIIRWHQYFSNVGIVENKTGCERFQFPTRRCEQPIFSSTRTRQALEGEQFPVQ